MSEASEKTPGTHKVYKDHNLRVLFGVTLMAVLGVSSITPALPEIRDEFGVSSGQVGLLITVFTVSGIVLTPVLGVVSDRHGRKKILVPALILSGASLTTALTSAQLGRLLTRFPEKTLLKFAFVLYTGGLSIVPFTPNLSLLLIPAVLFGIAQGINIPNLFSLLNAHAPSENRGAFMATNGMALRAGQTLGPLLMATAVAILGLTGAYLTAAALAAATLLLVLTFIR